MEKNFNLERKVDFSWIDGAIARATQFALTKEELDQLDESEDVQGGLSYEEYDNFIKKTENARIDLKYLHEYKYALEKLGYPEDAIIQTLAHENAHANKGSSLGADHKGYSLIIYMDKNGRFMLRQFALTKFPENWDQKKVLKVFKQISQAPEEYENQELSDGDKKQIEQIDKLKNK